jgi:hypothetical protein
MALIFAMAPVLAVSAAERRHDYPTAARADYVFACMAGNGQTSAMLNKCACSIDVIASIMTYERYVQAETVMRMRQVGGEKYAMFRTSQAARRAVDDLKRAQAESESRCF